MTKHTGQLDRLRRFQEILNDFGRAASETRKLKHVLHIACVQAARGLGIKHTKVMRYRPATGDLLVEEGVGWKPDVVGHATFGTDVASPPGRTLQSRQPIRVDDLPNDRGYRYSPVLREHGIISLVNAPVLMDSTVWGVLEVDSDIPRHFTDDDVMFLSALANCLGLVLLGFQNQQRASDQLAQARSEAENLHVLMRELVHRDKNDFQMVVSMLLLEMNKQQAPEAIRGFEHVIDRVSAISIAHDQLAMRPEQQTIDIATYLEALCGNLAHRKQGVEVRVRSDHVDLTRERAVSLGLIANELVTNAVKHAFPEGEGVVQVQFGADRADGQGSLVVADNGVGMGPPRAGSWGLTLVKRLAQQIGGTVEHEATPVGTRWRVTFLLVN